MIATISKYRVRRKVSNVIFFMIALIISLVFAFPLIWMVFQSLQTDPEAIYNLPPKFVGKPSVAGYIFIFQNWNVLRLLGNTMLIVVGVTVLTVASSVLCGYGFARIKARGKNFMFAMLLASSMLPFVVTLVPSLAIWTKLGVYGSFIPLIIPSIGGGAFNIFLVRMYIMNIPKALDESAEIDGCNKLQILYYIILPNLKPVIVTIILFTFTGVWGDYVTPSKYLWGYTNKYTVSIKLATSFKSEFGTMDWPKVMSACTLLTLPVLTLVFAFQNYFVKGIVTSGLKD